MHSNPTMPLCIRKKQIGSTDSIRFVQKTTASYLLLSRSKWVAGNMWIVGIQVGAEGVSLAGRIGRLYWPTLGCLLPVQPRLQIWHLCSTHETRHSLPSIAALTASPAHFPTDSCQPCLCRITSPAVTGRALHPTTPSATQGAPANRFALQKAVAVCTEPCSVWIKYARTRTDKALIYICQKAVEVMLVQGLGRKQRPRRGSCSGLVGARVMVMAGWSRTHRPIPA